MSAKRRLLYDVRPQNQTKICPRLAMIPSFSPPRTGALTLLLVLFLGACGDSERRCVDHEECFAGEFCDRNICRVYNGKTRTDKRPDAGLTYEPNMLKQLTFALQSHPRILRLRSPPAYPTIKAASMPRGRARAAPPPPQPPAIWP